MSLYHSSCRRPSVNSAFSHDWKLFVWCASLNCITLHESTPTVPEASRVLFSQLSTLRLENHRHLNTLLYSSLPNVCKIDFLDTQAKSWTDPQGFSRMEKSKFSFFLTILLINVPYISTARDTRVQAWLTHIKQ